GHQINKCSNWEESENDSSLDGLAATAVVDLEADSEVEENPTIISVESASARENRTRNTTPKSPLAPFTLSLPPNVGREGPSNVESSPPPRDNSSLNFFLEYGYGLADPGQLRTPTMEEIEAQISDGEREIYNEEFRRKNARE